MLWRSRCDSVAHCSASAQQSVKERLPTCLACHGENGQSQTTDVPSLGAQQAFYVTVQLLMFREKMRVADPMNDMAKGLTDDDLQDFAEIISKLPAPQPAAGPVDDARMSARAGAGPAKPLQLLPFAATLPASRTCRASATSARIIWSRRCAATRTIPATATTRRWPTSSRRSPTSRFWISPIISRGSGHSNDRNPVHRRRSARQNAGISRML